MFISGDFRRMFRRKNTDSLLVKNMDLSVHVFGVCTLSVIGPGSVVGIANAYRLDGPGIECRWDRDFPHLSRPALRATQPSVQWVPGFPRG